MNTLFTCLIAFLGTYLTVPLFRFVAVRYGIVDLPGRRKIHKSATPLLGGVTVYLGFLCGVFFNLRYIQSLVPVIIGASIILLVGLIDDIRKLSAQIRLVLQLAAATFVIVAGDRINFLPPGTGGTIIEVLLTYVWIIGVTNAYNYLDGMDGLAAGSLVVNASCFAVILFHSNQYFLMVAVVALAGACLGFLPFNLHNAKIFLGDAGSTLLGFVLASIAVIGNWAQDNFVKISIPILILGVPIFDMVFTTVMRIAEDKISSVADWLQYAGKDHFHHYLTDLGLPPLGAVLFIYATSLSLGLSAIMVSNDRTPEALLSLAQAAIMLWIIAVLIVAGKRLRKQPKGGDT